MVAEHSPPDAPVRAARQPTLLPWLHGLFAAVAVAALLAPSDARAQDCDTSQAQLTQAIVDSQSALDRTEGTLQSFQQAMTSPRQGALDTAPVVSAQTNIEEFVSALIDFRSQIGTIEQACGPGFANDVQTLDNLIARFRAQGDRADQLLGNHQALLDSGEPPMSQGQMETVQRFLSERGFFNNAIDGRFGDGTRASIRSWQAASNMSATGYLTPTQLQQILDAPPPATDTQEVRDISGLPPAPYTDGGEEQPPADTTPPDAAGQQVCADNTDRVNTAAQRTQDFRQQVSAEMRDLRNSLRQSRTSNYDPSAASDLLADVDAYMDQIVGFGGQAETVVNQCGDAYDASFAALTREIDALRGIRDGVVQLSEDYRALASSGEPVMSTQEMRQIQQGLSNRGHYTGAIDALFGPGTRNAIRSYQAEIGVEQTGYLTPIQAAELQRAAQSTAEVTPEPAAPETPETIESPRRVSADEVLRRVTEDLETRDSATPMSDIGRDTGAVGEIYAQLQAALDGGYAKSVVDQRFALLGAAYMERTADSSAMADAHVLVGEAYVELGLYADAAHHFQRAHAIWEALDRDEPAEQVWLLERLATVRLAQDLSDGELDDATAREINETLATARLTAGRSLGSDNALTRRIDDRRADLAAARDQSPDDEVVIRALEERYGR